MMVSEPPKTGNAVLDGAIIIAVALMTACTMGAAAWRVMSQKMESLTRSMAAVKHQVKNDHSTNLRDDVDALAASVQAVREASDVRTQQMATVLERVESVAKLMEASREEHQTFRDEIRAARDEQGGIRQDMRRTAKQLDALTAKVDGHHDRLARLDK